MAATGTPTPNIGLRIPQGTDPASVDDINYNSNLLDTKLGAVGNTSVQDQIDSLNRKTQYATEKVFYFQVPPNSSNSISVGTHGSLIAEGFIGESGSAIIGIIKFSSTLTVRNLMTGEGYSNSKLSITVSGSNVVFTSSSTQNSYFTIIKGYGQ